MELQLENISMIKKANVKLDGLTVIAGENDTGKSTVGKLLFSIIKAISRYQEDLEENKEDKIFSRIERNYFQLRRNIDFSENINLRELFYPPKFKRDLDKNNVNALDVRIEAIREIQQQSLFNHESDKHEYDDNYLKKIEENLLEIKKIFLSDENKQEAQSRAFRKVLMSEFKGIVSNQSELMHNQSIIRALDGDNKLIDVKMQKDKIISFESLDELYFRDATFIESPVILHISEAIDVSRAFFEEADKDNQLLRLRAPNIPLHIKDLHDKLKISFYGENLLDMADKLMAFSNLLNKLTQIIGGEVKYIKKERDFKYIKDDGKTYGSINIATGIKSFGILQMLIKSGLIDDRSLLILDEPEVHLHPKWQLKMAEFIVELVKNDISVLVSSHSPYMIEALKRYADRENIEDKTNFYLAEDGYIKKLNDSNSETLVAIYEKLSEPYDTFEQMESDRFTNG